MSRSDSGDLLERRQGLVRGLPPRTTRLRHRRRHHDVQRGRRREADRTDCGLRSSRRRSSDWVCSHHASDARWEHATTPRSHARSAKRVRPRRHARRSSATSCSTSTANGPNGSAQACGLTAVEPLWKQSTTDLYRDFLALGHARAHRHGARTASSTSRSSAAISPKIFSPISSRAMSIRAASVASITRSSPPAPLSPRHSGSGRWGAPPTAAASPKIWCSMSDTGLSADGVSFCYRGGQAVLSGVSVRIPDGGLIGILGPNGSGKTTLLRLLGGLAQP